MQDDQTGSWWQQVTGEALHGPMKGRRLELVFHDEISFADWQGEHPRGRVLKPDDSAPWRKFSENWEEETARLPVVTPVGKGEPLKPRDVVAGIRLEGRAKAYPLTALQHQNPVEDVVGGVPVIFVVGDDGRSVRTFDRRLDGREIHLFKKPGATPLRLVDAETGSEWTFAGEAVAGPLQGKKLGKVFVLKDYWFDWKAYNPSTEVYTPGRR
jgi:hypothetical protein